MRFYNVEMKGKFLLENRLSLEPYDSDDESRLVYYNDDVYVVDSTSNTKIWSEHNIAELSACLTSCGLDAASLDGQAGSYYLALANATGVLPVANGGTGSTTESGARTNLGLTGSSNTTHYHDSRYYTQSTAQTLFARCGGSNTFTGNVNCFLGSCIDICYNFCAGTAFKINHQGGAGDYSIFVTGNNSATPTGAAVGIYGWASNIGVMGGSQCNCGIVGCSQFGPSVWGNTAYCNASSKNLKHLNKICLTNCVRETPLNVYKYYWEDSNFKGFNETIGPTAEDFNNTFNVNNTDSGDEYEGLWTVDGAALGLALENLKEIDRMKATIVKLYECIQKDKSISEI